jgi:integrase
MDTEKQKCKKKSSKDYGIIQKKEKDGKVSWYARIVRIEGNGKKKQYTRKADSKSHARRLRDELADSFEDGGETAIEGDKMTFRELAEDYKIRKIIPAKYHQNRKVAGLRSHRTALNFLNNLLPHFGNKKIKEITPSMIEKFKQKRLDTAVKSTKKNKNGETEKSERPRAIASVNRELALLRAMLNDAIYNGWLARSPFLNAKGLVSLADETKRERILTFDEERRLIEACNEFVMLEYERSGKKITAKAKSNREHLKPLIIAALDTAMRFGELTKLCWRDVDFDKRTINILAFNTKTAKTRSVGMTERVFVELSQLWKQSPRDLDALVFGIKNNVKRSFTSACRDAKIEGFHFHDCRHTAITRMIQAGLSPMEIMKISGHTQMNTFARYVNPNTQAITRIADVLTAFHTQNLLSHPANELNEFIN